MFLFNFRTVFGCSRTCRLRSNSVQRAWPSEVEVLCRIESSGLCEAPLGSDARKA